jgi:8-amino-7-oxononanoate synthase
MAGQVRAALRLALAMDNERKRLLGLVDFLPRQLQLAGWGRPGRHSQIVPVVLGSNLDALSAAAFLQEQGFAVRAVRPPTVPPGTARLRLSLTTRLTIEHLAAALAALKAWRASQLSLVSTGQA